MTFFSSMDSHDQGGTSSHEDMPMLQALLCFTRALSTNYALCTNYRF